MILTRKQTEKICNGGVCEFTLLNEIDLKISIVSKKSYKRLFTQIEIVNKENIRIYPSSIKNYKLKEISKGYCDKIGMSITNRINKMIKEALGAEYKRWNY